MKPFYFLLFILFSVPHALLSFPTSMYWTVCITDVVPAGVVNVQLADYFTIFNKKGRGQRVPTDFGVTAGIFTWHEWEVEAGFDYFGGTDYPWFFNTKAGIKEGKLFSGSPSFSIGIYEIGTKAGVTNFNVAHAVLGKTLPHSKGAARAFVGGYVGSSTLRRDQVGWLVSYIHNFCKTTYWDKREFYKWAFMADYASGKNAEGGGGPGLMYNPTPDLSFIFGPTFFNDAKIYGYWKWTIQLDMLIPVCKPLKKEMTPAPTTTSTSQ